MAGRLLTLIYGTLSYVLFLGVFLYIVGFLCDFVVPNSINESASQSASEETTSAIIINVLLLGVFGIQHSGMARPAFKAWWTKIIPKQTERSTYVLLTNLVFGLLFWQWRPMPEVLWEITGSVGQIATYAVFAVGIGIVLLSTFLIDHFELFGIKQSFYYFTNREIPSGTFRPPLLYQYVRHPLMVGFLIALWATPLMTTGRLLFSVISTVYILVAVQLEERDLIAHFGEAYRAYSKRTPMLIPRPPGKSN